MIPSVSASVGRQIGQIPVFKYLSLKVQHVKIPFK